MTLSSQEVCHGSCGHVCPGDRCVPGPQTDTPVWAEPWKLGAAWNSTCGCLPVAGWKAGGFFCPEGAQAGGTGEAGVWGGRLEDISLCCGPALTLVPRLWTARVSVTGLGDSGPEAQGGRASAEVAAAGHLPGLPGHGLSGVWSDRAELCGPVCWEVTTTQGSVPLVTAPVPSSTPTPHHTYLFQGQPCSVPDAIIHSASIKCLLSVGSCAR